MDFEVLRWTTLHPALVHGPLGILPLAAFLYLVAFVRRSERWTFAADVSAVLGAVAIVVAGAFGLVAWFVLEWPGGLEGWPTVHLVLGLVSVGLWIAFAAARLAIRRRRPTPGLLPVFSSAALALLVLFTGWVGGEVLVFHAGMAVKGAGEGALAPTLWAEAEDPEGIDDAMGTIRGAWGAATAATAEMIVHEPSEPRFETVARAADRMEEASRWLADHTDEVHVHLEHAGAPPAEPEAAGKGEGEGAAPLTEEEWRTKLGAMSTALATFASQLGEAARARDLPQVSRRIGSIGAQCSRCHEQLRWR